MLGLQYLIAASKENALHAFLTDRFTETYFKGDEVDVFKFVHAFAKNHHAIPTISTLQGKFKELKSIDTAEPVSYYAEQVANRRLYSLFNTNLSEASKLLKEKKLPETIDLFKNMLHEALASTVRTMVSDFSVEGVDMVIANHNLLMSGDPSAIPFFTGWSVLDEMSGGLMAGDFVAIVGRPAMGKTFLMLFIAFNIWLSTGRPLLFISMEMNILAIAQRLVAMAGSLPLTHIKKAELTSKQLAKIKDQKDIFAALPNFYLVNGNLSADVDAIAALVAIYKPASLFVDGAYLLKHPNTRLDKYTRVADNAEKLKALTEQQEMRTIASYQLNREAAKKTSKKTGEKVGLEDIAYADAIGQISSVVLGLFQPDSVETLLGRDVEIMKGRDGQTGKFRINWDFQKMDFSQYVEPTVTSLQFV